MSRRNVARASAPELRAANALPRPGPLIDDRPVGDAEFAAALASLAAFEPAPRLAVAVSGGCDSMALAMLADRWARARGGSIRALIVDHGLRANSAAEAAQTLAWLGALGIAAEILAWTQARPLTRIEESARDARYRLLIDHCRQMGIADLLTAHQADDQAETVAMRLARGSSLEGLAGISGRTEREGVCILRPLLELPRARLAACLCAAGIAWIEDPSNQDLRFERNRWREAMSPELTASLRALARRFGHERAAIERRLAQWLERNVSLDEAGFARVDAGAFAALPGEIAARIAGRLAGTIGGRFYPPRRAGLRRALAQLRGGKDAASGGCLFRRRGQELRVIREFAAIASAGPVEPSARLSWDGRFELTPPVPGWLGPLGRDGWALVKSAIEAAGGSKSALPAAAAWTLPALWDETSGKSRKLLAVPDFLLLKHYGRGSFGPARLLPMETRFVPRHILAPAPFALVLPGEAPIY